MYGPPNTGKTTLVHKLFYGTNCFVPALSHFFKFANPNHSAQCILIDGFSPLQYQPYFPFLRLLLDNLGKSWRDMLIIGQAVGYNIARGPECLQAAIYSLRHSLVEK